MKSATRSEPARKTFNKKQLQQLFARIGATIETETKLLRKNPSADLSAANARKNRCLYELNLVSKELARYEIDDEVRTELSSLGVKIRENEVALQASMRATKDVIRILGDAITHAESDGTYPSVTRQVVHYE